MTKGKKSQGRKECVKGETEEKSHCHSTCSISIRLVLHWGVNREEVDHESIGSNNDIEAVQNIG